MYHLEEIEEEPVDLKFMSPGHEIGCRSINEAVEVEAVDEA